MTTDPYLELFNRLNLFVYNRTVDEAFIELGGITRELPKLGPSTIQSCQISHYLSNDLERQWVRVLDVHLTSSLAHSVVHNQIRSLSDRVLTITFESDDETVLSTKYSREMIKAVAYPQAGLTTVFLKSQLSGFSPEESLSFLANPFTDLDPNNELNIRLVSARSGRVAAENQPPDRMLQQRWRITDATLAMQKIVGAVDGTRWAVEQRLRSTENGPNARLKHIASADVVNLEAKEGYGQMELQATLIH